MTRNDSKPEVLDARYADWNHQVVTVKSDRKNTCKVPCKDCPWRRDAVGVFPAEAFRLSAHTAYDMSDRTFGCHTTGSSKPTVCAGFLLRGSAHNLKVRMNLIARNIDLSKVSDGGVDLFNSYAEMAIANGVAPEDPVLKPCRDNFS
ncbi:DUF6283 family protein [Pseudomonas sp. NY15437]|uniref:DUF6283 family protein n=1 Tax=Pseudomonas sp. NY15437 TaxID=3400360 RepID=UPI003A8A7D44